MFSVRSLVQVIFVCCLLALSHEAEGKKQKHKVAVYQRQRIRSVSYLLQLRDDNGNFFCAATLVASQFVVTAAKCFDDRDYTKAVVVAQADTLTDKGVQRKILKVAISDPTYNSENKNSNVAVLKLNEPFTGAGIEAIPVDDEPLKEKDAVLLWGWRHLVRNDNEFNNLYSVILNVTPQENCNQDFNATAERNHFCVAATGYEGHYPVGDLGGPAVRNKKLSGVAKACRNCENADHTISYIDLYKYQSFVASAMK